MHHTQGKVRECCHEESTLYRELIKMLTYGWLVLCQLEIRENYHFLPDKLQKDLPFKEFFNSQRGVPIPRSSTVILWIPATPSVRCSVPHYSNLVHYYYKLHGHIVLTSELQYSKLRFLFQFMNYVRQKTYVGTESSLFSGCLYIQKQTPEDAWILNILQFPYFNEFCYIPNLKDFCSTTASIVLNI